MADKDAALRIYRMALLLCSQNDDVADMARAALRMGEEAMQSHDSPESPPWYGETDCPYCSQRGLYLVPDVGWVCRSCHQRVDVMAEAS